jgi:PleD family two-component response regulator
MAVADTIGADLVAARRQAESIVERLRSRPLRVGPRERPISVTIGIATSASGSARDLFERADRALYAGATGRNCVVSDAD